MTNRLMAKMEKAGIPTHFVEELSERDTLVKKVSIVPLEVIIRNISAGHFASRYGVEEGIVFSEPTIEFSYKNDDLHDPLMNAYHAVALKLATWEEIELIKKYAFAVNDTLKAFWSECGVTLVDFKLEFGKTVDGQIVLADEISPDTTSSRRATFTKNAACSASLRLRRRTSRPMPTTRSTPSSTADRRARVSSSTTTACSARCATLAL